MVIVKCILTDVGGFESCVCCPTAHNAFMRRGEYKAILFTLFLLLRFFRFEKSSVFHKPTINHDLPSNLRAFAKRMRFISLVVTFLKRF